MVHMPQVRAFPAMDGIRGIAAILVALFHFRATFLHYDNNVIGDGYLAVDLFFVLSGFVLAHAYEHRFARGMTTFEFMRARVIRLYPLYFVGLAIASMAMFAGISRSPENQQSTLGFVDLSGDFHATGVVGSWWSDTSGQWRGLVTFL
jgi:peptidoglycan/LPS O-acetylase OafA/YrhL